MRICGRLLETGEPKVVVVDGTAIASVIPGADDPDIGGEEFWISPAFIDLQLNGYAGYDFNLSVWGREGGPEAALQALPALLGRAGTARFLPTVTTNSVEAIAESLTRLARVLESEPQLAEAVPGFHLEGPFLAVEDGPRGAHPIEHVRNPDWQLFQRWQEAAGGQIRICTLAPERPGALELIEKIVSSGVIAAIGHTAAEPETISAAVSAGATVATHIGNGAHAVLKRHPNYIWQQLAEDGLCASVIADGYHLPPSVLKCVARIKGPDRLILVSDAVTLGGLPLGEYQDGRFTVQPGGKITLSGTPYLAGAGHLLDICVANAMRHADLSPAEAVRCASTNPARLLGLEARTGRLEPGFDADITLFRRPTDGPLEVRATLCRGRRVY